MKTKIIYISGNEIFDMQDIRAAFDQVRAALALGPDTVLFGVPVDKADALSTDIAPAVSVKPAITMPDVEIPTPEIPEQIVADTPVETPDVIDNDIIADDTVTVEPAPVVVAAPQKKTRGRPKSVKKVEEEVVTPVADETPATQDTGKVVSILSVLTSKPEVTPDDDTPAPVDTEIIEPPVLETIAEIEETEIITDIDTTPIAEMDTASDELSVAEDIADIVADDIQEISIDDMITDDAPVAAQSQEQTLEQLLESMTPLREDIEHEHHAAVVDTLVDDDLDTATDPISMSDDDDATLEQLATEFAENQDKIATAPKTENQGKIGKLKNILPFKKARRDDSGLMGDLFGWAGIAANDEDFAIPGFFTNAASKK
ncbi:MAG: hypothetical protein K2M34_04535 [Alphaproteobacteria bacterium]|nr:hypothetical protein [Alphaproteobacteria bacterium]